MIDSSPLRLGVLLAAPSSSARAELAGDLIESARRRDHRVDVFLMHDGVDALADGTAAAWIAAGAGVSVCTQSAVHRRSPLDIDGVDYASQYVLATIVAEADRFVGLT